MHVYQYVHLCFLVCVLMWSTDIFLGCLTVRQKAWEAIFIEVLLVGLLWDFFSMAERGWPHTVRLPQLCVFVRAHVSPSVQAPFLWAPLRGLPGVCFGSCFVSKRALPRAAEVLPEEVGAHPQFCVSATKERIGAFREERTGRKGGEGRGAVSLGMSRPCGWLSAHSHTYCHSHDCS